MALHFSEFLEIIKFFRWLLPIGVLAQILINEKLKAGLSKEKSGPKTCLKIFSNVLL